MTLGPCQGVLLITSACNLMGSLVLQRCASCAATAQARRLGSKSNYHDPSDMPCLYAEDGCTHQAELIYPSRRHCRTQPCNALQIFEWLAGHGGFLSLDVIPGLSR